MKVAYYTLYVPHYRQGVFSELSLKQGVDLTVCTNLAYQAGLSLIKPSDVTFRLINRKTYILRVPFFKTCLFLQPEAIWSLLLGKYDVFVMSNRMTEISSWLTIVLGRLLGRSVCLWGHGFTERDGKWGTKMRKLMMRLASANILYSESGKDKAIEMGLAPEKLFVAHNALDTNRSKIIREGISTVDLDIFRKEHNIEDRILILFTGRLQKRKKPDVLIRAMKVVIEKFPNALAVIIGDGEMCEPIKELITKLHLKNNVRLTGSIYDEEILARFLMCSYMAVMPAHAGLSIQHAFDYGTPIVVGDDMAEHPPEIELIENGKTGIFAEDGNPEDFADVIIGLLNNLEKRQRMSTECKKLIKYKYNVKNMASGIFDAVEYCSGRGE